jgi:hypothetical protein
LKLDIVLARYSEPVDKLQWMVNTIRHFTQAYSIIICDASASLSPTSIEHATVLHSPNKGQEAGAYFWHICNNYENLADLTVFSQSDPLPHIDQDISRFFEKLRLLSVTDPVKPFSLLSQVSTITADGPMVPHIERLFPKSPLVQYGPNPLRDALAYLELPEAPAAYDICSGAVFAVSREAILSKPKSFYVRAHQWVGHGPKTYEVALLERLWPLLFKGRD